MDRGERRILNALGLRRAFVPLAALLHYVGELVWLLLDTLRWLAHPSSWRLQRMLEQMARIGWGSLMVVATISFTIGIAISFQIAYQLRKLGLANPIYTASFSALMVFREIGPVLTALIVAGRVGASITAELGMMNITQQIDALRTLATPPVKYLVVPRFLALMIGLPLLTLYANAIGVLGGYVVGTSQLGFGSTFYFKMAAALLGPRDLLSGLLKALVFAAIICTVSCYEGFCTEGGAAGVGRATTRSVVVSFLLIIAADALFTMIFYFAGP